MIKNSRVSSLSKLSRERYASNLLDSTVKLIIPKKNRTRDYVKNGQRTAYSERWLDSALSGYRAGLRSGALTVETAICSRSRHGHSKVIWLKWTPQHKPNQLVHISNYWHIRHGALLARRMREKVVNVKDKKPDILEMRRQSQRSWSETANQCFNHQQLRTNDQFGYSDRIHGPFLTWPCGTLCSHESESRRTAHFSEGIGKRGQGMLLIDE